MFAGHCRSAAIVALLAVVLLAVDAQITDPPTSALSSTTEAVSTTTPTPSNGSTASETATATPTPSFTNSTTATATATSNASTATTMSNTSTTTASPSTNSTSSAAGTTTTAVVTVSQTSWLNTNTTTNASTTSFAPTGTVPVTPPPPGATLTVRMITVVVTQDFDSFSSDMFRSAVAASVGTVANRVVIDSKARGSTIVRFYFSPGENVDAFTDAFVSTGYNSTEFRTHYTVNGVPTVRTETVPVGGPTSAPIADGPKDDDGGLSTGQVVVIVILVLVVVAAAVGGFCYWMHQKKKAQNPTGGAGRRRTAQDAGNTYGQATDMDHQV